MKLTTITVFVFLFCQTFSGFLQVVLLSKLDSISKNISSNIEVFEDKSVTFPANEVLNKP